MIKKIFIILLMYTNASNAVNIQCNFEEVYSDGTQQQGLLITKNNLIRYEYIDNNLFTIFFDSQNFYMVKHNQKNNFYKIDKDKGFISLLSNIINKYPNIEDTFEYDGTKVKLEKSRTSNFYRKITILNHNINFVVYFNYCSEIDIHDRYLRFSPYFEILD